MMHAIMDVNNSLLTESDKLLAILNTLASTPVENVRDVNGSHIAGLTWGDTAQREDRLAPTTATQDIPNNNAIARSQDSRVIKLEQMRIEAAKLEVELLQLYQQRQATVFVHNHRKRNW